MADVITILVNGMPFEGWLVYKSHHSFDKASGTLDLTISPQPGQPMPIKMGDQIVAMVAGTPVLTGHVHLIDGDDDWGHDKRVIHARDKTQDFVDSTVGPQKPHRPPVSLQQVLQKTVSDMGLSFSVIDNVNPPKFEKGEVPVAGIDETGHAFGDRLGRQRQTLLNTDGKGNLVIDRNNMNKRGPGALLRYPPENPMCAANNILKAKYHNSDLDRHNMHATNSQHSTNDMGYWEGKAKGFQPAQADPTQKQYGVAYDTSVRQQRKRHHRARHSLQRDKTKDASKWRANVAKGRGFQYHATVQGFEQVPGAIWWPGFIIPVADYKYEISAELLIKDVTFHRDWKGGSTTELSLTYADAFSKSDGKNSARSGRTGSYGSGAPADQGSANPGDLEAVGGD